MQPTIASFFQRNPSSSHKSKQQSVLNETPTCSNSRKRKAVIISSDEDNEIQELAMSTIVSKNKRSRIDRIVEKQKTPTSTNTKSSKKINLAKLKASPEKRPIDPIVLFATETKRIEAKKSLKPKEKAIIEFEDNEIDKSLMDVDFGETNGQIDQSNIKNSKIKEEPSNNHCSKKTKKISPKQKLEKSPKKDLETSILSDEERYERKRVAAALYQKYKNRSSVINHGCKEIPTGSPNCLAGLSFLVTGILESLERDEANDLIKQYGGKVMTTVGKRLNYLIVGEEAGPKKIAQAEENGIKIISEDDLFNLIRDKSTMKKENDQNNIAETIKSKLNSSEKKTLSSKKDNEKFSKIKEEALFNKKRKIDQQIESNIDCENKRKKSPKNNLKSPNNMINSKNDVKVNLKSPVKIEIKVEHNGKSTNNEIKSPYKNLDLKKDVKSMSKIGNEIITWVDKYKPTSVKDIIGQQGVNSNVQKLINWLSNWYTNHDGKKKLAKPNPWAKNDSGNCFKAVLLSGPPGIGKTTTATLVCEELGFDAVEFNASDTRSKRLLQEEVSELLSNKSLYGFCHGSFAPITKKHVLLMDEVDGMAGNEDRGGIQELINLIKNSSVPIICMCNDRNHSKIRSLVNYCYDLRFNRPQLKQIKGCILSICSKENIKVDSNQIDEIITATNNDIRQSINYVALLSADKKFNFPSTVDDGKVAHKDLKLGPWEVVRKVFSVDEHKGMSLMDKYELFFHDYSMGPLFVHENYLNVNPIAHPKMDKMDKIAFTADSISLGDLIEKKIRSQSAWSLLPTQATFSSVIPGEYMKGYFTRQINFPSWLGKNSRMTKRSRLAQEIHDHTRTQTSASRHSIRLDYAKFLLQNILNPLKKKGLEGVADSLNVLKTYHLLREDIDSLVELSSCAGTKSLLESVDGKVKAALTRAYNKEVLAYSYSAEVGIKKKRLDIIDDTDFIDLNLDEEGVLSIDSTDEDDINKDALIKTKSRGAYSKASKDSSKTTNTKKSSSSISKSKTIVKNKK